MSQERKIKGLTRTDREFIRDYRTYDGNLNIMSEVTGKSVKSLQRTMGKELVKQEINNTMEFCRGQLSNMAPQIIVELRALMKDQKTPANVCSQIGFGLLDRAGLAIPKAPAVAVSINTAISDRARALLATKIEANEACTNVL